MKYKLLFKKVSVLFFVDVQIFISVLMVIDVVNSLFFVYFWKKNLR